MKLGEGGFTYFYITAQISSVYYSGATAEFIDERPTCNGTIEPLAEYGTVQWQYCDANNTEAFVTNEEYYPYEMVYTINGDELSWPDSTPTNVYDGDGNLIGTGFTDHWKACL